MGLNLKSYFPGGEKELSGLEIEKIIDANMNMLDIIDDKRPNVTQQDVEKYTEGSKVTLNIHRYAPTVEGDKNIMLSLFLAKQNGLISLNGRELDIKQYIYPEERYTQPVDGKFKEMIKEFNTYLKEATN